MHTFGSIPTIKDPGEDEQLHNLLWYPDLRRRSLVRRQVAHASRMLRMLVTMEKMPMMIAILFSWERARGMMLKGMACHNYEKGHVYSGGCVGEE